MNIGIGVRITSSSRIMAPLVLGIMAVTMTVLVPFIIWDAIATSSESNWAISAAFIFAFISLIGLSVYAGMNTFQLYFSRTSGVKMLRLINIFQTMSVNEKFENLLLKVIFHELTLF